MVDAEGRCETTEEMKHRLCTLKIHRNLLHTSLNELLQFYQRLDETYRIVEGKEDLGILQEKIMSIYTDVWEKLKRTNKRIRLITVYFMDVEDNDQEK